MAFETVFKNGTIINHAGRGQADIGVKDQKIVEIGDLSTKNAETIIDLKGLTIFPGVIDSQVHFREPGLEHKEDLYTGSLAAAKGGVTAVFEMPNTNPATTDADLFLDKLERAKKMAVDHAFYAGATAENRADLVEMEQIRGCCGVKVFMGSSTGSLLVSKDEQIEQVLKVIRRRAAFHAEDEDRLNDLADRRVKGDVSSHPVWRDEDTALKATKRLVRLAEKTQKKIHLLHVTTAQEMAFIKDKKKLVSVEVTPQHLTLSAPKAYDELGSLAQMNPPIRGADHQQALWAALDQGVVDVIGSDHAPHTLEEKSESYPASPSGMPGVQTFVPIMLHHVQQGRLSLERFVDLTSAGPQRLFNIAGKGRLAVGYDADLTIVDMNSKFKITNEDQLNKSGWTPFDQMELSAKPVMTVVRGNIVMQDGEVSGFNLNGHHGHSEPVQFLL